MSKRTLSFVGILVAFVFLLAINTNVFSIKKCEEMECASFNECYRMYPPNPDEAKCTVLVPDYLVVCEAEQYASSCNFEQAITCCQQDPKGCTVKIEGLSKKLDRD